MRRLYILSRQMDLPWSQFLGIRLRCKRSNICSPARKSPVLSTVAVINFLSSVRPNRDMDSIQPSQLILPMDMAWASEDFGPAEAIGTAAIANYPLALAQTLPAAIQGFDTMNALLDSDALSEVGVVGARSRYHSLDFGRTDTDPSMSISRRRSLTDDLKESAKEVRHDYPP